MGLDHRFVEPVLLKEVLVLRVPYERKVGVENRAPESERIRWKRRVTDGRDRSLPPGLEAPTG